MQSTLNLFPCSEAPLRLLLAVDRRPSVSEHVQRIQQRLTSLQESYRFEWQMVDVVEQPYIAEYFRLVATPALVKVYPEPRQTLMGSNLLAQLDRYWSRWQHAADEYLQDLESQAHTPETIPLHGAGRSIAYSSEVIRLSDEIFRLEKEKEELESLLQFKDRVIEVLAHDLRNPLAATSMALETLEAGMKPNTIQAAKLTEALKQRLLSHARTQVRMIDRMVSHLLQTAQGNQAVIRIQPQKTDLQEVFAGVLESLRDRLQVQGLVLSTDIPQDLPKVYADPDRIEQVLANLLDNAIKYTPQGGKIQVAALHRTSQKVQITVCDNGPGIPTDKQKQIFEDRFRLQRDRGNANGYGLGLALCKRTISAHYGEIWVDSEPGSGSCFHFTLPVYQ